MLLFVLDVGFEVFQQSARQLGEIIDIVHRVEDTVNKTLGQLTCGSHLLLTNQLMLGFFQVSEGRLQTL